MSRYPTPTELASSSLDELMGYWAGLGYYARARNLHRAAQQVVDEYNGRVPDDPEAFAKLSGVGAYTCGAVQSIAFGHPLPVVDGNVIRVLSRLDFIDQDPKKASVKKGFWTRAEELLDEDRPGDFNQSMMELGATVCTPKKPKCLLCPLESVCVGRQETDVEKLPFKTKRSPRPRIERIAALVRDEQGRIWVGRRPPKGLLGGLWALPSAVGSTPDVLTNLGLTPGEHISKIEHGFTHQVWDVHTYHAMGKPCGGEYSEYQCLTVDALENIGLSGPSLKALRASGVGLKHRRGAG